MTEINKNVHNSKRKDFIYDTVMHDCINTRAHELISMTMAQCGLSIIDSTDSFNNEMVYLWEGIETPSVKMVFIMKGVSVESIIKSVHMLAFDMSLDSEERMDYLIVFKYITINNPTDIRVVSDDYDINSVFGKIIKYVNMNKRERKMKRITYRDVVFSVSYLSTRISPNVFNHSIEVFHGDCKDSLFTESFETESPFITNLPGMLQDIFDDIIENDIWDENKFEEWDGDMNPYIEEDEDTSFDLSSSMIDMLTDMYESETIVYRKIAIGIILGPYVSNLDSLADMFMFSDDPDMTKVLNHLVDIREMIQ